MNKMRMRGVWRKAAAALLALAILGLAVCIVGITAYADEVSSMTAQSATIKGDSVNTRSGAGTNYDKVEALTGGTQVTVTGQANDSDGTVWYQVTLPSGKTAFVRNDFLELGEVIEQEPAEPEEPVAEEPVEPEPVEPEEPVEAAPIVSDQYVALYEEDDTGTYYWYLHNNDDNYRVKIDDLLDAARSVDEVDAIEKQNKTLKMALIIMGVVLVILVIILVVLIFRLRDYMYYEEEEEDDEEEEEPRRGSFFKRKRDEDLLEDDDEEEAPRRNPRRQAGRDYAEEQAARQARPASRGEVQRPQRQTTPQQRPRESEQTRRARNIMRDDDDMSFEFLNLDDDGNS